MVTLSYAIWLWIAQVWDKNHPDGKSICLFYPSLEGWMFILFNHLGIILSLTGQILIEALVCSPYCLNSEGSRKASLCSQGALFLRGDHNYIIKLLPHTAISTGSVAKTKTKKTQIRWTLEVTLLRIQNLLQLKISCVSLGKLYSLSELPFPHVKNGYLMRLFWGLNKIKYYKVVSTT